MLAAAGHSRRNRDQVEKAAIEMLGHASWAVRLVALEVLGQQPRPSDGSDGSTGDDAVDAVLPLLSDRHWWARRHAAEALGRRARSSAEVAAAANGLSRALLDEDRLVRRAAATAAMGLAAADAGAVERLDDVVAPPLIAMLDDHDR